MKYLIVKQLSIDNHFPWDIWFHGLLSVYIAKIIHIKHVASHHFPKYFHSIKKRSLNIGLLSTCTLAFFLNRCMMVVRKNVLEYIIALVVVKNKVRLKKCLNFFSNMTKFYCPNKSIYYFFKVNTRISTSFRQSMLISFWIDMTSICTLSMS